VTGKLVRKGVSRVSVDLALCSMEKGQKLHADEMHVNGKKFSVIFCNPLNLTVQT